MRRALDPFLPIVGVAGLLALAAAELGHEALALTDHDGLWGAMEFAQACRGQGVRPIVGAEMTVFEPERPERRSHLTLLAENAIGWRNLCRAMTASHAHTRPHSDRDPLPPPLALAALGAGAVLAAWRAAPAADPLRLPAAVMRAASIGYRCRT